MGEDQPPQGQPFSGGVEREKQEVDRRNTGRAAIDRHQELLGKWIRIEQDKLTLIDVVGREDKDQTPEDPK